jgi:hypothetical protein
MRRTSVATVGASLLATLLLIPPAHAGQVRGFDPDDRAPIGADPDIRSSVLSIGPREDGRFLVLVVRAYEDFLDYWVIQARFDTQGERRADHTMTLWNADTGGSGCSVRERGQGNPSEDGIFRQRGRAVRCRVPIRRLEPDRSIRWRLVSDSGYVDGNREQAPDVGMYP